MSESVRLSSSLSLRSVRIPSLVARPEWPWSSRSYRTDRLTPQGSWGSYTTPIVTPSLGSSTSSAPGRLNMGSICRSSNVTGYMMGESTRQWTLMGFEWVIRDVGKLRDYIEGVENPVTDQTIQAAENGDFELLKQSPILGDNKFKLEIAHTLPNEREGGLDTLSKPTLSLFITSLMVDYAHGNYETPTSISAAIRCQDDRVGERGARPQWVWELWENSWVFRQGSEVWECPLPTLSALLNNDKIQETDSMVICVQIHTPVGLSLPQHPSLHHIPSDLLDGLESLLDNSNTGDVRFICLEKLGLDSPVVSPTESSAPTNNRSSSSISASHSVSNQMTARKRIIYAHSDILSRRSEYFATMFSSAFSESSNVENGERKLYTVIVEEADFQTIYWLLKYCYGNWLSFRENDDPRAAVEGVGVGWSAKWLGDHDGEWDWKTIHKGFLTDDCARSVASCESVPISSTVSGSARSTSEKSTAYRTVNNPPSHTSVTPTSYPKATVSKSQGLISAGVNSQSRQAATSRRLAPAVPSLSNSTTLTVQTPTQTNIPMTSTKPVAPVSYQMRHPSTSPRSARQPQTTLIPTPDPHPHPTPAPGPASALSIYQVAHRYGMPNLAAIAVDHIMSTISPQTSFAFLLATSQWDELHTLIEDYVIDKWEEVSFTEEFELDCQEVAAGEWGPEGGKILTDVFRRLRAPNVTVT